MFKKAFLILITAILIIEGGGCGMNSNDIAKEQEKFNEWLKEFLEEQELPNDYSKLNDGQQYSVKRIYEMIMYLEDKYGIEFEYTGYVRAQILENEHLTAIPKGGNEKTDTVTVTCEDDGTFTDDYPNVAVRPYYEQMITDYVKNYFGSDKVRVFSRIFNTTIEDLSNISEESIIGNVIGNSTVFISNDICNENEVKEFASIFAKWMQENHFVSDTQFMLLYNPDIEELNPDKYSDYYSKNNIKIRLTCSVESDGRIIISNNKLYI